jgi:hypothetical protein
MPLGSKSISSITLNTRQQHTAGICLHLPQPVTLICCSPTRDIECDDREKHRLKSKPL